MKTLAFALGLLLLCAWIAGMIGLFPIGSSFHAVLLACILLFMISFTRDRRSVV